MKYLSDSLKIANISLKKLELSISDTYTVNFLIIYYLGSFLVYTLKFWNVPITKILKKTFFDVMS